MANYRFGLGYLASASCLTLMTALPLAAATLTLQQVLPNNGAQPDPRRPVDIEAAPGDPTRAYIVDLLQERILIYDPATDTVLPTPFLDDIPETVRTLSVAFDPDYETNGQVYVFHRQRDIGLEQTMVSRYTLKPGSRDELDPTSRTTIITIPKTGTDDHNHWGGDLTFGVDGMLYVTVGDSAESPIGPNPAQDLSQPHGKVLRLDVTSDGFPADPDRTYAIPADNPVLDGVQSEIWAFGLRNPFKAAWDSVTGRYFIADVGEDRWEEINLGVAGANFGWSAFEGPDVQPEAPAPQNPLNSEGVLTAPFYSFPHGLAEFDGNSVTGGHVYRGTIGLLDGQYIFGDFGLFEDGPNTGGRIWSFAADLPAIGPGDVTQWGVKVLNGGSLDTVLSFGFDGAGAYYVSDYDGDVFRIIAATVPVAPSGVLAATGFGALMAAGRRRRQRRGG